jgi:hypothetical protein
VLYSQSTWSIQALIRPNIPWSPDPVSIPGVDLSSLRRNPFGCIGIALTVGYCSVQPLAKIGRRASPPRKLFESWCPLPSPNPSPPPR